MADLSRRAFLGTGTAMGLGAMLAPAAEAKPYDPMPTKWDEEVDVLIVGSGFAGLAAALEAKKKGANVVVLEKMRTLGGNSIINGGIMAVPGSPMQKKNGIKDTPELLAEDMLREGQGLNDPNKVRTRVNQALPTWRGMSSGLNGILITSCRKAATPSPAARLPETAPAPRS